MERQTARSFSTASQASNSVSPVDFGDKCFLCSHVINIDMPPVEQREFYMSKNGGMFMCHSSCIDKMNRAGGTPADFHRVVKPADVEQLTSVEEVKPPVQEQGPGWLHFEKLSDYNAYVVARGAIDSSVKITAGNALLQAGE